MFRWLFVLLFWPSFAAAQSLLAIEQQLNAIGYDVGQVDGFADANTRRAVLSFQYNFGFLATGQLSQEQVTFLDRAHQISKVTTPFVVEEKREQHQTPEERFLGRGFAKYDRVIYANGAHYLAERGYFQYNPGNRNLSSSSDREPMEDSSNRAKRFRNQADAIAQNQRDPLASALLLLHKWKDASEPIDSTISAFLTVLEHAQSGPPEPAYVAALAEGARRRMGSGDMCRDRRVAEAFFPGLKASVQFATATDLAPHVWSGLLITAIACAPPDHKEALHKIRLEQSALYSNHAQVLTVLAAARDADDRGDAESARRMFTWVHDRLRDRSGQTYFETEDHAAVATYDDVARMARLGLRTQAREAGEKRIASLEAKPAFSLDLSRAELGGRLYELYNSAVMFMQAEQYDYLRRLGVLLSSPRYMEVREGLGFFDAEAGPWQGALIGLRRLERDEQYRELHDLAQGVIPLVLEERAFSEALEISLMQAEATVIIGAYQDAEPALVRAVTLAQRLNRLAEVKSRVDDVRYALNLSRLTGSEPGKLLITQIDFYYEGNCRDGTPIDKERSWFFPEIDYRALGDDPRVVRAVVEDNTLARMMTCRPKLEMEQDEITLFCAVAALVGRKDVIDYVLHPEVRKTNYDYGQWFLQSCAIGLAHVGRMDWFKPFLPATETDEQSENLRFLAMTPTERRALMARLQPTESYKPYWQSDWKQLELERPHQQRKEVLEKFAISFEGSHGNMGTQASDYVRAHNTAIAFERMGLFGLAEAFLYISYPIDPVDETIEALSLDLFRPEALSKRVTYASLYRKQGRHNRAYEVIGPLAELAVERLSSDGDPLPGTVEQWAQRLEPLFTQYLELQFEGLAQGPNYPALFAMQQYLQLAGSTASLSVLEQRLNSASPEMARQYQDTLRALRVALNAPEQNESRIVELNQRLQALGAGLPDQDAARRSHQIGVTQDLRTVVRAMHDTDAAMLVATQLQDATILTYVDGKGARARKLARSEGSVASQVTAFRRGVTESSAQLDLFDQAGAARLYDDLIGWGHMGEDEPPSELRLVLTGPLATLPFAALRHDGTWLGATTVLRAAPSVARAASELRKPEQGRGFVGLGDPNLTDGDLAARKTLLGANAALPELPETAAELAFMALAFGGNPSRDVFTRDNASERQMRRLNRTDRLAEAGILALATHGLLSRETGALGAAGLLLSLPETPGTDGILAAPEIYNYRIGADLVILSACNTGTPGAGEGLSDLASAFLYAGAGSLLLTHWEIDSGAGVELMKRVATSQRTGAAEDFSTSIQQAVAGLLADPELARFHHPRFWASHFILG